MIGRAMEAPLLGSARSAPGLMRMPEQEYRRVGVCSLVVIGFFWVSGGIYGNEELVSAAPPLIVCAFTVLMPVAFSLPTALMTAELATAFPAHGGQVTWVELACGPELGGHNAYWIWLTNLFDAAVYPQMATKYLASQLSMSNAMEQWLCWLVVLVVTALNLGGLEWVTSSQSIIFGVALAPCLLYILIGIPSIRGGELLALDGPIDWRCNS